MSNFTSKDVKKHRISALRNGVMIGMGVGILLIGFILNRLYALFSNFYHLFPEAALPLIIQIDRVAFLLFILGVILTFSGGIYEYSKRKKLSN